MRQRIRLIAALVLLLLAAGTTWWLVRQGSPAREDRKSAEPQSMAGMAGMDDTSQGSVTLTAEQIRSFGVTFGMVERRELASSVRGTGVVRVDETRVTQVTTKVAGFVERLYADFAGQSLRQGQPLYALYSPDLVAAQEELLAAARLPTGTGATAVPGLPSGEADLRRAAERRLRLWDVSESQVLDILRRGTAQRTVTFYSPAAGVIVDKQVVRGQAIEPGQVLYMIADLSRVWVEVDLREGDAAAVRTGAQAEVELAAYPGHPLRGRVAFLAPTLEAESRAFRARIEVPNADGRLRPGMYGTVRIRSAGGSALTVPTSAVVRTGERSVVFVDLLGGRFAAREVKTGRTEGGFTEVLAGLEPGQRVVTSAQFLLESESNLSEIMRGMIGQTGSAEMPEGEGSKLDGGVGDSAADVREMSGMVMPDRR